MTEITTERGGKIIVDAVSYPNRVETFIYCGRGGAPEGELVGTIQVNVGQTEDGTFRVELIDPHGQAVRYEFK